MPTQPQLEGVNRDFSEPFAVVTKHIDNVSGRDCDLPLVSPIADLDRGTATMDSVYVSSVYDIDSVSPDAGHRVREQPEFSVNPLARLDIVVQDVEVLSAVVHREELLTHIALTPGHVDFPQRYLNIHNFPFLDCLCALVTRISPLHALYHTLYLYVNILQYAISV